MEPWSQKALAAVASVQHKLSDGTYAMEESSCLCGVQPASETEVTRVDRYGIPHRMVMCDYCTLMRANPRMTEAAYREFYNTEYRPIYDGFEWHDKADDDEFLYQNQLATGRSACEFLVEQEVEPKVVVEVGSYLGGGLVPWQERGCQVYGVDLYERGARYAKERHGIETVASVEDLIARGIKADLILASDFIEHLCDPLRELSRWKHLLTPKKGRVFIYTPGFLAIPPRRAFQNAHTYQFIGATVDMIFRRLGYVPDLIDDRSISLWRYVEGGGQIPELPHEWRRYVVEHLEQTEHRAIPPVWTQCKFGEKEMLDNLDFNLAYRYPHFSEAVHTKQGPCLIIAGGPSVDGQVEQIKALQAQGCAVMVIERMYPWATKQGIRVDYVIALDASEGVEEGFTHLQPDAMHFIAATMNKKILPLLHGYKVMVWSSVLSAVEDAIALWQKHGYAKLTVLNTGGSVALGATTLAIMLGHRQLHVFGMDLMVPKGQHDYAAGIAGESVNRKYFEVVVDGETVMTCSAFIAFAQQFFSMTEIARKWGMLESIDIYGESLINKMWDRGQSDLSPVLLKA